MRSRPATLAHAFLCTLAAAGCGHAFSTGPEGSLPPPTPEMTDTLRCDMAETLLSRGAPRDALPILQAAVKTQPQSPRVHALLGIAYRELALPRRSEEELKTALALNPQYAIAWAAIGMLYDQEHRSDDALKAHRRAVELEASCVKCWNNLGFSLYLAHQDREAIKAYEKAIELDPSASIVFNNLGFAYARLGDEANAKKAFTRGSGEKGAAQNLSLSRELNTKEAR